MRKKQEIDPEEIEGPGNFGNCFLGGLCFPDLGVSESRVIAGPNLLKRFDWRGKAGMAGGIFVVVVVLLVIVAVIVIIVVVVVVGRDGRVRVRGSDSGEKTWRLD